MSTQSQNQSNNTALSVLTALFFMMGFITCMNDILIPHLKAIFDLTYFQAMLIQFCFFTAYAIMSMPMGKLVEKVGYKNGVIGGFLLTAVGCLLFYPAAGSASSCALKPSTISTISPLRRFSSSLTHATSSPIGAPWIDSQVLVSSRASTT